MPRKHHNKLHLPKSFRSHFNPSVSRYEILGSLPPEIEESRSSAESLHHRYLAANIGRVISQASFSAFFNKLQDIVYPYHIERWWQAGIVYVNGRQLVQQARIDASSNSLAAEPPNPVAAVNSAISRLMETSILSLETTGPISNIQVGQVFTRAWGRNHRQLRATVHDTPSVLYPEGYLLEGEIAISRGVLGMNLAPNDNATPAKHIQTAALGVINCTDDTKIWKALNRAEPHLPKTVSLTGIGYVETPHPAVEYSP